MNGDGFADVLVGALGFLSTQGGAYVYLGSATGPSTTPIALTGTNYSGASVGCDGRSDVLVGAPGSYGSHAQSVGVFFGTSTGVNATPVELGNFAGFSFAWFAGADRPVRRHA